MSGGYGVATRTNGLRPGQARDNQRSRLYAAEQVLRGLRTSTAARRHLTDSVRHGSDMVLVNLPDSEETVRVPMYYPSVASTQDYVNAVLASAWFRRRWGYRRQPIEHSHGRGSCAWDHGIIALSCQHRRSEAVILHEIAHTLTSRTAAHHGPEFAGILLTLVSGVMGAEHGRALRESFREHRVKYTLREVPKPDNRRRDLADRKAASVGHKPRRTTRTPAVERKVPRRTAPLSYEQCYFYGSQSHTGDPSDGLQRREGFDADAYTDGYLDAAAGRERYHLRDCTAHHNGEGGCGVA